MGQSDPTLKARSPAGVVTRYSVHPHVHSEVSCRTPFQRKIPAEGNEISRHREGRGRLLRTRSVELRKGKWGERGAQGA